MSKQDIKYGHNPNLDTNYLIKNGFSADPNMHEVHRFQHFATMNLALSGKKFHLGQFHTLVKSDRGLLLATLRRGEMAIRSATGIEAIKPADFAIIPLEADVSFDSEDCELDCLIIDEQLKPLLPKGLDEQAPVILSALIPATSLLYQQFICFRAYTNLMQEKDAEDLLPPLLMMLNIIFKRHGKSKTPVESGLLDKVCDYIKDHLLDPELTPDMVADQLGVSRARLYRLAEPLGGIQKYIRSQRLQLAYEKLQQGGEGARSISNLAFDLGFGTETAFRRAFKASFGITPSQLRRREKITSETN